MKKDKTDFDYCMFIQTLKNAADGKDCDRKYIIGKLSEIHGFSGNGEADDYRFLAYMQKVPDDTFAVLCRTALNNLTDGRPEDYNPLVSASKKVLDEKRRQLYNLEKEVDELEGIEKYNELKQVRGGKPFGGDHPDFDDKQLEWEFQQLRKRYDPYSVDDDAE